MTSALRTLLLRIAKGNNDSQRAASFTDSEDSRNSPRHSSIQGPYREGVSDTSFPVYRTVDIPFRSGQIYARSLLSLGHGIGLKDIIGNLGRPKWHIEGGAFIGDVGSIDDTGSFSFCFNIFAPSTHPVNQRELPQNFVPFEPPISEEDCILTPRIFDPGTILASEGIAISRVPNSASKVKFKTSAREGAVLVLPTGATREEFINPSKLYPYIREHASSWYQFYNGPSDDVATYPPTPNGVLWVVIGVDRATSWSTVTFPVRREDVGKRRQFIFDGESPTSHWEDNSGPYTPEFKTRYLTDGTQGAIFLRVVAVALSPSEWSSNVAYIPPESVECYASLPVPITGRQARAHYSLPHLSHFARRNSLRTPELTFHPSIPLLNILILTDTTARVAVVPDSVWISQLSRRHLTHPEIVELISKVIDNFDIVNTDGLVTFVPKAQSEGDQKPSNSQQKHQVWFIDLILSWLKKDRDESIRGRALRNMSKVLSPS